MALNLNALPLSVAQAMSSQAFNVEQEKVLAALGSGQVAFIAVQGTFADLTAATTAYNNLTAAMKVAGVMAPS